MLTNRYVFKSNELKYNYINGSIDHQQYLSSLEDIKKEELTSVVFDFKQRRQSNWKLKEEEKKMQQQTFEQKLSKARTDFYEKEAPALIERKNASKSWMIAIPKTVDRLPNRKTMQELLASHSDSVTFYFTDLMFWHYLT